MRTHMRNWLAGNDSREYSVRFDPSRRSFCIIVKDDKVSRTTHVSRMEADYAKIDLIDFVSDCMTEEVDSACPPGEATLLREVLNNPPADAPAKPLPSRK